MFEPPKFWNVLLEFSSPSGLNSGCAHTSWINHEASQMCHSILGKELQTFISSLAHKNTHWIKPLEESVTIQAIHVRIGNHRQPLRSIEAIKKSKTFTFQEANFRLSSECARKMEPMAASNPLPSCPDDVSQKNREKRKAIKKKQLFTNEIIFICLLISRMFMSFYTSLWMKP